MLKREFLSPQPLQADYWVQRARDADILKIAQGLQPKLRRNGAEWCGPCPAGCALADGFSISPRKRVFICRPSCSGGDIIAMVQHALDCDFKSACAQITGQDRPDATIVSLKAVMRQRGGVCAKPLRAPLEGRSEQEAAYQRERVERRQAALQTWQRGFPIVGTLGERYFVGRAIDCPLSPELRFHPELRHWPSGGYWPGIVARVTGVDGQFSGVHLTFLTRDGAANKALGCKRKLMLGAVRGGAVRLADTVGDAPLLVGEGIETCLSVQQATGYSAWAALSTSGMRALALPNNIHVVLILADGDDAGEAAAQACAARWTAEGRRARIARPPRGMDFNDIAIAHAGGSQ